MTASATTSVTTASTAETSAARLKRLRRYDPIPAIFIIAFLVLPLMTSDAVIQNVLILTMVWTFWATSLNVIWGYAGQFSMAQVGLGGLTAYMLAILVTKQGWGIIPAILAGVAGTVLVSVIIGLTCLRLQGFRFAIMTLAFSLAGIGLATNLQIAGRTTGITVNSTWAVVKIGPLDWGLSSRDGGFAMFMYLVFLLVVLSLWLILRTREGRGLLAIREDALLAESLGLSSRRYRLVAFALGAVAASIAGVFQASYYGFIYPSLFSFETLVTVIVVLVLGGRGHLFGPLVGGLVYSTLTTGFHLGGKYQTAVFGALVIIITIFARHGLTYYLGRGERFVFAFIVDGTVRREALSKITSGGFRLGRRRQVATDENADLTNDQLLAETIRENTDDPALVATVAASRPPIGEPLLEVRGVSKSFGGVHASRDLTFEVRQGEIVGVIGPNGAGKTTVFNLISGFMRPDAGSINWQGTDVTKVAANRRSRMGLVRTFQQPRTFPALTVRENLVIAAQSTPLTTGGVPRRPAAESVDDIITMFGFEAIADGAASDLSYGFAKRLGVAMAVATNPMLVLLDEPAAGLNSQDIRQLCNDLLALRAAGGSICIVEHHMDLVMEICDRVIVLDVGNVIATGSPDEVMNHPRVIEAYLGAPA